MARDNDREFTRRERISKEIWEPSIGQGRDIASENAPIGAPKSRAKVNSIFDARPINAYDFYSTGPGVNVNDYTGGGG